MEYLDDGELWLPSNIFPSSNHNYDHDYDRFSHNNSISSFNEVPVKKFSQLNFHNQYLISTPTFSSLSYFQGFGGMEEYAFTPHAPNGCLGLTVGPTPIDYGLHNYSTGPIFSAPPQSSPRYPMRIPLYPPLQVAIGGSMETRIGSVSMLENQKNRPFPFPANQPGFGSFKPGHRGGPSLGTGVFIPRAAVNHTNEAISHGGGEGILGVSRHKNSTIKIGASKGEEYDHCHHVAPHLGLPKDWTY